MRGIPEGWYSDEGEWERERQLLWPRAWLLAGRAEEVSGPGQYFTWERTGIPLLVVGSTDGVTRAFYNSCRHRGAPVVREPRGRSRALRCQYHSWTYDTTGRLVSAPDERDFVDLRFEQRSLVPAHCAVVDGWILVSERAEAELPALPPAEGLRFLHRIVFRVPGNWKAAVEVLRRWQAKAGEAGAVFPNVALPASWDARPAVGAWPVVWPVRDVQLCEVEAVFLAPDWGEEDSPLETAEWQERIAAVEAELQELAGEWRDG